MRKIIVKVHPSKANLKKKNQLAWKIAEIASDKAKIDKNAVEMVIRDDINGLSFASERLLNDSEYMLSIIKRNARAFNFCGKKLRDDQSFRAAAIRCNSVVKEILGS